VLRFKSLGSGSSGNATLIEAVGTPPLRLLVDCGLGLKPLLQRLAQAGRGPEDIHAVFITHEHADHIGCARTLCLRWRIPVWMSHGTHAALGSPDFEGLLHTARDGEPIDLGGLELMPFTVPHDAREPLQLSCTDGSTKLGILTDLGHATAHVMAHMAACNAMLLECNHDREMLRQSSYPLFLKQRVSGQYGHLSNAAAADIASALAHNRLKHLVAAHLSAQNNRPGLVRELMRKAMGCGCGDLVVADAASGTPWLQI
jgi:phosphoribosyl 1,2-cyclic phosphodiesterase